MRTWLVGRSSRAAVKLDRPGSASGFTLVELLVVLSIVAVAASFALPPLGRGLDHWRLQGAVREVATLMKFARNRSVAMRRPLQVILDRSRNLYWLDNADKPALADPDQVTHTAVRLYALPAGIRFGEIFRDDSPVGTERVGMVFFPRGSATGGEVVILDDRGRSYRIGVDAVTGRATVVRHRG